MGKRKTAPAPAPPSGPSRERNDRETCPDLAAMRELYSLLLACRGNGGARTCHVLPAVDAKRLELIERAAKYEGFGVDLESGSDRTVVSVWKQ